MAETLTETEAPTGLSTQSVIVRQRMREFCTAELAKLIPQPDSHARGLWNEETIRKLTAVFELQRLELNSESQFHRLDIGMIAHIIDLLAGKKYFPDLGSSSLLFQLEPHLRLLAAALRLYKHNGCSLEHKLYSEVYDGITRLWDDGKSNQTHRSERYRVEEWNTLFLVTHCQYLLLSIDNSESLRRKIARRATIGLDGALAGASHSFHNVREPLLAIIKRRRSRPRWHDEYIELEDACSSIFAGDIKVRGGERGYVSILVEEAIEVTRTLHDSLEAHLQHHSQTNKVKTFFRHSFGFLSHELQESGPYEEHGDYLEYGILDLLYQLSFRIRKRARKYCFGYTVKAIRNVLEKSESSAKHLHLKATDLWNRISELGETDQLAYGDKEDRVAIHYWIRRKNHVEVPNYSTEFVLPKSIC